MKLGLLKRIPKEQLSKAGELPGWIDALLDPLNEFIEKVGLSLQGRLTLEDNFLGKMVTQEFTSGTELEINPRNSNQANLAVQGILILQSEDLLVTSWGWQRKTNGNIGVTVNFATGTIADVKLFILLG